jgi:hypothetical protein
VTSESLPYVEMFCEIRGFRACPNLNPDQEVMLEMLVLIESQSERDVSALVDALVVKHQQWKGPQLHPTWSSVQRGAR